MEARRRVHAFALLAAAFLNVSGACFAAQEEGSYPVPLETWTKPSLGADWLSLDLAKELFPGADALEPVQADLSVAPVFGDGVLQGYIFATRDITESLGFSSLEFVIVVGLRLDGTLAGVRVVEHREPIIDLIMLQDLVPRFAGQYVDVDIRAPLRVHLSQTDAPGAIDGISSATISAVLFNEAILRASRMVAHAKGIRLHDHPVLDIVTYRPERFVALVEQGSLGRLRITRAAAEEAGVIDPDLSGSGGTTRDLYVYVNEREAGVTVPEFPEDLVLDIYAGPAMTPTVGRNVLGDKWYDLFVSGRDPNDLMLAVMTNGPYSIDSDRHLSSGSFRRLRLVQEGKDFDLSKDNYRFLGFLHGSDKPRFSEMGLFWIPAESGINPVKPWSLEVLVENRGGTQAAWFQLDYTISEEFVLMPTGLDTLAAENPMPVWVAAWQAQRVNIVVLITALALLTVILVGMDWLAKRPSLLRTVRIGFLSFVLVWMGWQVGAQVTILNVLTWLQSLVSWTGLVVVLSDPLIMIVMVFVTVTFFLFGRGIFCGWLCPFGALQELLAKAAQALKVRQVEINHRWHRRLWPVKYVVLAGLVGSSFYSMDVAGIASEVEPFKTAISLKFDREWPYVVWAVALLGAGVFIERFFCRFICPLGAAMAVGGKLRLVNLLNRRPECGSPCQLCARRCPIGAIEPSGAIRMDECFYCLDCQELYHDEHVCPPLVRSRRRAKVLPTADESVSGAVAGS